MVAFECYFGKTFVEHEQRFAALSKQGYRMSSLCIYSDPHHPRYAAVWLKLPGPDYVAFARNSADDTQNFYDTWTKKGFWPALISATGEGSEVRFAGVFEKSPIHFNFRFGLSWQEFLKFGDESLHPWHVLRSATIYDGYKQTVAAIYTTIQDTITQSSMGPMMDSPNSFQHHYDSLAPDGWFPDQILVHKGLYYASWVLLNNPLHPDRLPWHQGLTFSECKVRHNLNAKQFQKNFDDLTALGFYPYRVQTDGEGSDSRFAAVFLKG